MNTTTRLITALVATSLLLNGCAASNGSGKLSTTSRALLCTAGGVAGSYIGKRLAQSLIAKSNKQLSAAQIDTYTKGFQIGLFLAFCAIADYAGKTMYKKMSEDGLKRREEQLLQAAASAKATTYTDPVNTSLTGNITIEDSYVADDQSKECVDLQDSLSDGTTTEQSFVRYCRVLPNGTYAITAT